MSGSAADFPGKYPVLIGTRAFDVNTSYEAFRRQSTHHDTIPSQREAVNLSDLAGGLGAVNTEGLWRRGQVTWHHGGGQLYLDRKDSDPSRFLYSQGVDPWNQNQLTLLPATVKRLDDSTTYNFDGVAIADDYVYTLQSKTQPSGAYVVKFTKDWSSFTTPTGLPNGSGGILHIATDGYHVWVSGTDGVWVTTAGGASWSQVITDQCAGIWYVSNRLIVAVGAQLWDITACTGAAQALAAGVAFNFMTAELNNSVWFSLTGGQAFIYGCVGHYAADATLISGAIWSFAVQPQGIQLAYGQKALPLEKGEVALCLYAYQNFIFVGTNLGARCCRTISNYDPTGNAGDLVAGPILPNLTQSQGPPPFQPQVSGFVSGFVGYGRFVWFTWSGFAGLDGNTYWALGRFDLGTFLGELQPAYASDLLVQTSTLSDFSTNSSLDWDPVTNGPLMVVQSNGFYTIDYNVSISGATKYVHTGYLRSGRITWDITDMKTVAQANLKTAPSNQYSPFDTAGGTVTLSVSYDQGGFSALTPLAPNTQANPPVLVTPLTPAEEVEIETVLTAGAVSHTDDTRPFLSRWMAKALPNVVSGIYIYVAVKLYTENLVNDAPDFTDPYGDYAYLENLRLAQTIVDYKEGSALAGATQFAAKVVVNELYWMPHKERDNADGGYEGDLVVTLKSIVG